MYSSTLPSTSALDGGSWSTPRPGRFTPGKETWYPLRRRLGEPRGRSGRVRKISPPPGFDPQTVQPVASCSEGVSKIFRTDTVKVINLTTKHMWKLPTSTQLRATWHADSLDMVVLPSTCTSRCHNCCIDGGTSPEYFGYTLVYRLSYTGMSQRCQHDLNFACSFEDIVSEYVI
jgi:hypothetical protein